jgi:putative secretion ATPase (PEP-CTERM system associated)
MYESFYGLSEKPFSLLPDPAFLYMSEKHRMALAMLQYGLMNQAGFTVITGEIGSGKTTLVRQLLNDIDDDVVVGLVTNTHRNFGELLQWVLLAFGLEYRNKKKVELYQTLADYIAEEYAQERRTVLIIDEAQNLSPDALEELRMLSNINADKNQVLQLILVGQPGLRDVLRRPQLQQFAQRVAVDFALRALNLEETWNYIRHRVQVAGGEPGLFDTRACAAVYYYTGGTPRLVNVLCDTALVYGYAEQKRRIDAETIVAVVRDKARGGIFPVREQRAAPEAATVPDAGGPAKESRDM